MTKARLPRKLVWAMGVVWVALLPVGAALAGLDSFLARLGSAVVAAVLGAAFALFVGGVLIERWQASAEAAADREAAAHWNLRIRYIVQGLLEEIGRELDAIVQEAYSVLLPARERRQEIRAQDLRDAVRIPHRVEGPLTDAIDQASELHEALMETLDLLGREFHARSDASHAAVIKDADPDWVPEEAPTAEELAEAVDIDTLSAIRAAGARSATKLGRRTVALHGYMTELTSYYDLEAPELLTETIAMRNAAREMMKANEDVDGAYREALAATTCLFAAEELLQKADHLARQLSRLHDDVSAGTRPNLDPLAGSIENFVDSQQVLQKGLKETGYTIRRSGPDTEEVLARARRALDRVRSEAREEAPGDAPTDHL
jgi:hypothetical protein